MASNNLIPPSVNALASQIAGLPGQAYDYVTGRAKEIYQDPIGDVKRTLKKTQEKLDKTRDLQAKAFGGKSKTHEDITEEEAMSLLSEEMLGNIMNFAPAGIVKQAGGQFLKGTGPEVFTDSPYHLLGMSDDVKKWMNTVGKNYMRNQMGTVDDPLRKLANEGIVADEVATALTRKPRPSTEAKIVRTAAEKLGVPNAGAAPDIKTPQAAWWDNAADEAFTITPASRFQYTGPRLGTENFVGPRIEQEMRDNPWLARTSPETPIHDIRPFAPGFKSTFNNVAGQLQKELDAGLIRPEQLSKVSMPDAVTRTHREMIKKIAAENDIGKTALVHKEYPTGDKWVELGPLPGTPKDAKSDFRLKSLLGQEGRKMANCVGDYCNAVGKGNTKIYSLRDAKGEPHITIEVKPSRVYTPIGDIPPNGIDAMRAAYRAKYPYATPWDSAGFTHASVDIDGNIIPINMSYTTPEQFAEMVKPSIAQIKGKGNTTKLKPEYQALVDDFIGDPKQWADIKK